MNRCVAPQEIQEGDLAAYLEGAASPNVIAHIARCSACAQEVQELAATKALLLGALYRDHCPSPLTLLEYRNGFLSPAERRKVEEHLRSCAECRREMDGLPAPAAAAEGSPQSTGPAPQAGPGDDSLFRRFKEAGKRFLTATLMPFPQQPAWAWRGEDRAARVYRAGAYRFVLSVTPPPVGDRAFQVEGQILPEDASLEPPQGTVHLFRQGQVWGQEDVDDTGFFALDDVPRGHYTLVLDLTGIGIIVEGFSVP